MSCALTIGGSDSSGGAGIQADIKTFTVFKVFGTSALTCVTAQNSLGIQALYEISSAIVKSQIHSVLDDMSVSAIKIGMVYSSDIIKTIALTLDNYTIKNIVLDPIIWTKKGTHALDKNGLDMLKDHLCKRALLITPNLDEAGALTGRSITNLEEMKWAARQIYHMGPSYVLIKGGHLPDKPYDVLFDGKKEFISTREKIGARAVHGTGCTLSAAITASLALGMDIYDAVMAAQKYIAAVIQNAMQLGEGFLQPQHWL
ncbi:MAG: bifunctional hydroxymethylpyrimidine kinase/phosphomethylpyrimidine kinase [bacterium]